MVIDKEEHRKILLDMFKNMQFQGVILKQANELLTAIEEAEIGNSK